MNISLPGIKKQHLYNLKDGDRQDEAKTVIIMLSIKLKRLVLCPVGGLENEFILVHVTSAADITATFCPKMSIKSHKPQ